MERKTIKTSKNILTHWSRTPNDLTPACGTKGDDWILTPADEHFSEGADVIACYKCQRKYGRRS